MEKKPESKRKLVFWGDFHARCEKGDQLKFNTVLMKALSPGKTKRADVPPTKMKVGKIMGGKASQVCEALKARWQVRLGGVGRKGGKRETTGKKV